MLTRAEYCCKAVRGLRGGGGRDVLEGVVVKTLIWWWMEAAEGWSSLKLVFIHDVR
jgi:hypothetical protein